MINASVQEYFFIKKKKIYTLRWCFILKNHNTTGSDPARQLKAQPNLPGASACLHNC